MAGSTRAASQSLAYIPTTGGSLTDQLLAASNTATSTEVDPRLKTSSPRKRRRSPEAQSAAITNTSLQKSPSPIRSPLQVTGASEMAEQQKRRRIEKAKEQSLQTSKNPQIEALNTLVGAQNNAVSKVDGAQDPAATTISAPIAAIAPAISVADQPSDGTSVLTSPVSAGSGGAVDNGIAANAPPAPMEMGSPGQIGDDDGQEDAPADPDNSLDVETPGNKAFSYPGPLTAAQLDAAKRGMSLPGSGRRRDSSRSPSTSKQKHKCPFCATEFTRHHNLKSHLLTHSHEKPYLCQQCDSRFRRLHDLKRHTKLHTGERPHVCPKCNRSFARGDALARHNKGQGGCAGRRSSVGSYGADQPIDEPMEGMVYTNQASDEPEAMNEDEAAGASVPSIRHYAPGSSSFHVDTQPARQPSTYPPPPAARANMGPGLHPPAPSHGGSGGGHSHSGSGSSHQAFPAATPYPPANVLGGPSPMTESPKPLSPGRQQSVSVGDPRNRSPSISSALGSSLNRTAHQRATPPPLAPPPAHSGSHQLPSLPSLAPPDPRYTLHSQAGSGGSIPAPTLPQPQASSYPTAGVRTTPSNSLSSHGSHPHSSGERGHLPFSSEERVLAIIKGLEAKVDRLEEEVRMLRGQVQQQQQPPPVQAPVQAPLPATGR